MMKDLLDQREQEFFSPLACCSDRAIRRRQDRHDESGYRQAFSIDADRVLNSLAYTRYIDKTQVFSLIRNDHLTHRVLHVQLVSRIARTIGRFLGLNEDLIEAASLGHDLGHPPFGHDGETILSQLCRQHGAGFFHHNRQSVQFLEKIERRGMGWNLNLQTLDAILCHNGEVHTPMIKPDWSRTFDEFDAAVSSMGACSNPYLIPMTLEGCVVRMADPIAYLGRDMEDAIRLKLIQREDLPPVCSQLLGNTNGTIVYNLVTDLITNSLGKPHLAFSDDISQALEAFRTFNYTHIYTNPRIKGHMPAVRQIYTYLFDTCMEAIRKEDPSSPVISKFLRDLPESYRTAASNAEIVRDYIAGMTDSYFLHQAPENMRPWSMEASGV
ncbi:MAG: HD domain-containing protein [Pseudomonadota bacterium]